MYLQNKYTTWYFNIIQRAQTRIPNDNEYYERHHVVPKSLGGNNSKENLALLTAREHFICHKLLVNMVSDITFKRKMIMARYMMLKNSKNHQRHVVNGVEYQRLKQVWVIALSESKKGKPGIPRSEETRKKMSEKHTGRKHSPETLEKIRQAALGRQHTEETKAKFANRVGNRTGVKLSEETKEKMRQSRLARKTAQKTRI